MAEAEQARLDARGCRRDQVETDLEMLRSSQASTHPSPHSSLLISASFLTVRNVMQGKAAGDEMSERLAEQTREIATLRAQLAAAPSLDVDDMGGMSLGESLGGELEAEALAPPPVAALGELGVGVSRRVGS